MRKIRLTEGKLNQIIRESIKKTLKEGFATGDESYDKFEQIKEILGADEMINDIYNYLDDTTLKKLIEYFNQDYDLFNDFDDE